MEEKFMEEQFKKLSRRIKYDKDTFGLYDDYVETLYNLLEDSYHIALSILYPFSNYSSTVLPKKYSNWQIRACVEIYTMVGRQNIASYSENGLTWTMFKSGLSKDLLNELTSRVGTPQRLIYENESESEDNVI